MRRRSTYEQFDVRAEQRLGDWSPGLTIPNLVTVQVGSDGSIKFYNGSSGTTQVVVDTAGYYLSY